MKKKLGILLVAACVLYGYVHSLPKNIATRRLETIVEVRAEVKAKDFFGEQYVAKVMGTGTIISDDGVILTAGHVIDDALKVWIVMPGGVVTYPAESWEVDPKLDVGIVKINCDGKLPVSRLGNSDRLKFGDYVFTIGNPLGLIRTLSIGVVSNKSLSLVDYSGDAREYLALMQISAPTYPGNSGGPVFNRFGRIVGIVSGGVRGTATLNFMTPINHCRGFLARHLNETK